MARTWFDRVRCIRLFLCIVSFGQPEAESPPDTSCHIIPAPVHQQRLLMKSINKNSSPLLTIIVVLYFIFFTSIFFSLRAMTSISVGALLIAGVARHKGNL